MFVALRRSPAARDRAVEPRCPTVLRAPRREGGVTQRPLLSAVGSVLSLIVLSPGSAARAQERTQSPPIDLPTDAAMHPSANTEWWYWSGRVADAAGHTFSIEVIFLKRFDVQHYYPDAPYPALYRADVAITDENGAALPQRHDLHLAGA